jgi:hypothetical protein
MLDTIAPVCLGTVKRPIRDLEKVCEFPAWINRDCYSDADGCRQRIRSELQRCRLEV